MPGSIPWLHRFTDQRDEADIAGALPIAKQCALDAVCTGHQREFGRGDGGSPVIMRMQRIDDALAVAHIADHPLDLVGMNIRRRDLDRVGQVEDQPLFREGS